MMRRVDHKTREEAGFTLLETLIALFVVSILSAVGASLLFTTLQAGKQVDAHTEILRDMQIAHALVRDDIAAMTERPAAPASGYEDSVALIGLPGGAEGVLLSFVRGGWVNPDGFEARSDLQRVEYRLENGDLIRTSWDRPDATRSTPVTQRIVASGLTRVDLRYAKGGEWSETWKASALIPGRKLPDVVEMIWTYSGEDTLRQVFPAGGRS